MLRLALASLLVAFVAAQVNYGVTPSYAPRPPTSPTYPSYPPPSYPSPPTYPPPSYPPPSYPTPSYPSPPTYPPPSYPPPSYPPPSYPTPSYPQPQTYPPPSYPQPQTYPPPSYPSPPTYPPPRYPQPQTYPPAPAPVVHPQPVFSPHELAKAEEYAHRIANEKVFLRNRVNVLKDQKQDLLDNLNYAINLEQNVFNPKQQDQNSKLDNIKDQIKELLHDLGDKEAELAGEVSIAKTELALVFDIWARIESLDETNANQDALIVKIDTLLQETKQKLYEKLTNLKAQGHDDVNTVHSNLAAAADWFNTRHCQRFTAQVEINGNQGSTYVNIPTAVFKGSVPNAVCALQGFVSHLNLDQTQNAPAYGQYPDDRQNLAVAIDCKPFADKVQVEAFDQSRGSGNSVAFAYVEVKVCSYAAQAGPKHS